MLLTRSPLTLLRYCYQMERVRLACVRHAASVRPEPGSNSPSRLQPDSRPHEEVEARQESESCPVLTRTMTTTGTLTPKGSRACVYCVIDVQSVLTGEPARTDCPHWLLALTLPFSRSDRAHTCSAGVGAGCPKDCSGRRNAPESLLRLSEGHSGPFRRVGYLSRPLDGRQRAPGPCTGTPQGWPDGPGRPLSRA